MKILEEKEVIVFLINHKNLITAACTNDSLSSVTFNSYTRVVKDRLRNMVKSRLQEEKVALR